MSFYEGPALVVVGTDKYEVTATLRTHTEHHVIHSATDPDTVLTGLSSWDGSIAVAHDGVAWELSEAASARIQLPDGRAGTFFVLGGALGAPGPSSLDVRGTGPAPF